MIGPNLQLISEGDDEITYLLLRIDPFGNNMITYSEIVQLLSTHMVSSDNPYEVNYIPLLEKFANLLNADIPPYRPML